MLSIIKNINNKLLRNFIKKSIKYLFLNKILKLEIKNIFNKSLKLNKTNIYITYNTLSNQGYIYKKYKYSLDKHKLINLDFISFKYNKDFYLYNVFFLEENNRFKNKLNKLKFYLSKIKKENERGNKKILKKLIKLNYKIFM
jgi:hypothetical protein